MHAQDLKVSEHGAAGFAPHIAADSSGNFIIVWDDYRNVKIPYGGNGSNGDIYGRRYNKKGQPIGNDFRISDDSISTDISFANQIFPRVSMNKQGEFVVTWVDTRPKGDLVDPSIPAEFNIYAQRYDKNGNPTGSNFLVNDSASGGQLNPDVVMRNDGRFIIIWINTLDGEGGVNRNFAINLQCFNSNGEKVNANKKIELYAQLPKIALFENGNFVITADTTAQIFSFPSNELGLPFRIADGFTRVIKTSKNNKIYIVHMENRIIMDQFIDSDIFFQMYDALGNPLSNKIVVNDDDTNYWQVNPTLSVDDENVFIAWQDYRNGYQMGDGICEDIYGQRFDLSLTRIGNNFKVSHEENESGQNTPTSILRNDSMYIAWFDHRSMEYFNSVYPPKPKVDVWATIQDFNRPIEGNVIYCRPPASEPPSSFYLFQGFPNPTQAEMTFIYDLTEDADVKLSLYNILGREVKKLIVKFQKAGRYSKGFIINDLASGIYFARLMAETSAGSLKTAVVKIALIK